MYCVSGGELSTDVVTVERMLDDIFKMAKKWEAVVLLDEADVLMTKRSSMELGRNAIVAGILILVFT